MLTKYINLLFVDSHSYRLQGLTTNFTIHKLKPHTQYEITVTVRNSVRESEPVTSRVRTQFSGMIASFCDRFMCLFDHREHQTAILSFESEAEMHG